MLRKDPYQHVKSLGVNTVTMKYVHPNGSWQELPLKIDDLPDDFLTTGLRHGNVSLMPNPSLAMLNPFLETPILTILCDLRESDPISTPVSSSLSDLSVSTSSFTSSSISSSDLILQTEKVSLSTNSPSATPMEPSSPLPPSPTPPPSTPSSQSYLSPITSSSSSSSSPASPTGVVPAINLASHAVSFSVAPVVATVSAPMSPPSDSETSGDCSSPTNEDSQAEYGSTRQQIQQYKVHGKVPKSHKGTSCHQCKNTKPLKKLAFCANLFHKRTKPEKRVCRKKYCETCLRKFYNEKLEIIMNKAWVCASCRNMCCCAACSRIKQKGSTTQRTPRMRPRSASVSDIDPSCIAEISLPQYPSLWTQPNFQAQALAYYQAQAHVHALASQHPLEYPQPFPSLTIPNPTFVPLYAYDPSIPSPTPQLTSLPFPTQSSPLPSPSISPAPSPSPPPPPPPPLTTSTSEPHPSPTSAFRSLAPRPSSRSHQVGSSSFRTVFSKHSPETENSSSGPLDSTTVSKKTGRLFLSRRNSPKVTSRRRGGSSPSAENSSSSSSSSTSSSTTTTNFSLANLFLTSPRNQQPLNSTVSPSSTTSSGSTRTYSPKRSYESTTSGGESSDLEMSPQQRTKRLSHRSIGVIKSSSNETFALFSNGQMINTRDRTDSNSSTKSDSKLVRTNSSGNMYKSTSHPTMMDESSPSDLSFSGGSSTNISRSSTNTSLQDGGNRFFPRGFMSEQNSHSGNNTTNPSPSPITVLPPGSREHHHHHGHGHRGHHSENNSMDLDNIDMEQQQQQQHRKRGSSMDSSISNSTIDNPSSSPKAWSLLNAAKMLEQLCSPTSSPESRSRENLFPSRPTSTASTRSIISTFSDKSTNENEGNNTSVFVNLPPATPGQTSMVRSIGKSGTSVSLPTSPSGKLLGALNRLQSLTT